MAYRTENYISKSTKTSHLVQYLDMLGYKKILRPSFRDENEIGKYYFFEKMDYLSWSGLILTLLKGDDELIVRIQSTAARSHYDLEFQNFTVKTIKQYFGGTFASDKGKGRYMHASGIPPTPAQSGCYLAFQRFGSNLLRTDTYVESRRFPNSWDETGTFDFLDDMNPRILSNNLLIPYIISVSEDFFKSTFIALLKYSERKEAILKNSRPTGENLVKVSMNNASIEEATAEALSFQSISKISENFHNIDPRIDILGQLKKPNGNRKHSLYEVLDLLVEKRHKFIHHNEIDISLEEKQIIQIINDLEVIVTRCYSHILETNKWPFLKMWSRGRKRSRDLKTKT